MYNPLYMTEFILCGTGWRAEFFLRIASSLSERFKIACVYTRHGERADLIEKRGFRVVTNLLEALSVPHSAVIVASGKEGFLPLLEFLSSRGETILSETTFLSLTPDERYRASLISGYALEQYWHTPLYASIYKAKDKIGEIESVYLSALHSHHAASIMRGLFPDEEISCIKRLIDATGRCIKTGSRKGMERGLEMEDYSRKITAVTFKSGKCFITDFSSNQYHNYIIPSHIEIRGTRGVLTERGVTYVLSNGYPVREDFVFGREEDKISHAPTLSHVSLGEEVVFQNIFYPHSLSDDEIAIASMLDEFSSGTLSYSISSAVIDAEIGESF